MSEQTRRWRWGVLGTGRAASDLVGVLQALPDAEVVAVGSRTSESARAFARRHGIRRPHGSYAGLLADPGVDVVHVATVTSAHHDLCVEALGAGKAVLCEKPLALDAAGARAIAAAARASTTFCMEGLWTRFLPAGVEARRLVRSGAVGEPRALTASVGYRHPLPAGDRLLDPALGGGSLLDLGVYPASLAHHLLGPVERVRGWVSAPDGGGADRQSAALLEHVDGAVSQVTAAIDATLPNALTLTGTTGRITLPGLLRTDRLVVEPTPALRARPGIVPVRLVRRLRDRPRTHRLPVEGNGLVHQVREVHRCLAAGLTESDVMPLAESVAVLETLDRIRAGAA